MREEGKESPVKKIRKIILENFFYVSLWHENKVEQVRKFELQINEDEFEYKKQKN